MFVEWMPSRGSTALHFEVLSGAAMQLTFTKPSELLNAQSAANLAINSKPGPVCAIKGYIISPYASLLAQHWVGGPKAISDHSLHPSLHKL
jgi:hypothetical protein